jgi:hypothetical protein
VDKKIATWPRAKQQWAGAKMDFRHWAVKRKTDGRYWSCVIGWNDVLTANCVYTDYTEAQKRAQRDRELEVVEVEIIEVGGLDDD